VASKSGQFTADETGKGQFVRENLRNLAEEGVVRKISSPRRVADVPILCNDRGQRAGNMGKKKCYSGVAERVRQFITEKSSVTGTHWKLRRASQEKSESERSQTFYKDFGWKNAGAVERRTSADWESVRKKMACFQMGVTPFQSMYQCKTFS